MYYVTNRRKHILHPLIRKHVFSGSIVMTDEHASYMSTLSGRSRLADYGLFHFFLNHNANEYIHHKFPFVSNSLIETNWARMKKTIPALVSAKEPRTINTYLDYYSCRMQIKHDKLYDFVLKEINHYYFEML